VFQQFCSKFSSDRRSTYSRYYLPDEEATVDRYGNPPTIRIDVAICRELVKVANLANDRDFLIELMDYLTANVRNTPLSPFYVWEKSRTLIVEGVPQN
jgi:hypothetical protein